MLSQYTAILNAKMSAGNQTTFGHILKQYNQSQRSPTVRQTLSDFDEHPEEGMRVGAYCWFRILSTLLHPVLSQNPIKCNNSTFESSIMSISNALHTTCWQKRLHLINVSLSEVLYVHTEPVPIKTQLHYFLWAEILHLRAVLIGMTFL